jgi:hypothetical protein
VPSKAPWRMHSPWGVQQREGTAWRGRGGDAEGGEGSSKAEKVIVGGVGGAKTAKNVAQAKLMLEKLDYGVAALMMSILRADETLNILAEN